MNVTWDGENVCVSHPREPWGAHSMDHYVLVHTRLDDLYGKLLPNSAGQEWYPLYLRAKSEGDGDAARRVVGRCISPQKIDILAEIVSKIIELKQPPPLLVFPLSVELQDDAASSAVRAGNGLPAAMSYYLSQRLGCPEDREIYQISVVKRTKLLRRARLLNQPAFKGSIQKGRYYIVLDDVVTLGGTFAALRSHILRGGGRIAAITALAHANGHDFRLSITDATLSQLVCEYGPKLITYWSQTFKHSLADMTEEEGLLLLNYVRYEWKHVPVGDDRLELLRERINFAAGRRRKA